MVSRATAAPIWLPQPKTFDLNVATTDEKITSSTPTNQRSLLSRPIKNGHNCDPKQQKLQVGDLETKPAS